MLKYKLHRTIGALAAFALCLALGPSCLAAAPEDEPEKGTVPAIRCELSDSSYAEPSAWEPEPVEADVLLIGLSFGNTAVYEARFVNEDGGGFRIGSLDGDRRLVPTVTTDSAALTVRYEKQWYLLLDQVFPSRSDAESSASRYQGRIITLDGEVRLVLGPFRSVEEVDYTRRWYAVSGTEWRESCLAVYGGGRLIDLFVNARELALEPVSDGKGRTLYGGEDYRGAFLLRLGEDGRLSVINAVGLEDYVKGVVPYEMSASWPVEALKAQAVCARTYAAYHLGEYAEEYGFDLTNDTESQVYRGLREADAVTDAAVDATAGQFVRWHGELCEVYYFSSDGGATEDGLHIFGSDRPYLAGKTDPFEAAVDDAVMKWRRWRGGEEIAERLRGLGYEIGRVVRIEAAYTELGNVAAMSYYDADGVCVTLEHRDGYKFLSLDSARFRVTADGNGFLFVGRGWGHNCGMSQWGANAMASVYGCTADEIIRFYFTGAYIG